MELYLQVESLVKLGGPVVTFGLCRMLPLLVT